MFIAPAMSRLTRSLFAAVLGLCLVTGSARASQVVFGNLGNDGSEALSGTKSDLTATTWYAQGFTVGSTSTLLNLDSIVLGLGAKAGGSISNVSISIRTNSGGNPASASLFTSADLTVTGLSAAKYTFSFAGASLTTNTTYWVVLNNPDLSWYTDDDFATPEEQNLSGYDYFGTRRTTNSATSWSNFGQTSLAISVNASSTAPEPIPEPGTWAAAALLIGAAAYVRWRRRPQAA
jgi:hypothetical protein